MTNDEHDSLGAFRAEQVVRPRAQVERQLKKAILAGQFAQGERLPTETKLAEQFGVSRPTIREALGALVAAGLISKTSGISGGSFVNNVTTGGLSETLGESVSTILRLGAVEIGEITVVRQVLEVPAARMAATSRNRSHIARMEEILDHQRTTTIDDPNIPAYDLEFHSTIGDASGNRLLGAFIRALHSATSPTQFLALTPEVGKTSVKQHIAIAAAIKAGDESKAAKAMEEHLDYVLKYSPHAGAE